MPVINAKEIGEVTVDLNKLLHQRNSMYNLYEIES